MSVYELSIVALVGAILAFAALAIALASHLVCRWEQRLTRAAQTARPRPGEVHRRG